MQIIVRIILLALLPVVCVCCDRPDRGLLRIEQAMKADPYPARALAMLDSVDSAGFSGSRASAVLHGLLRSELLLKNRLPLATDSMLEAAAEYYAAHNDPLRHAEALHYSALWHLNQADYPGAMRRSAAALDVASAIPDTLLMARCHEVMADIYNGTYNIESEIRHRRMANILYGRTQSRLNHLMSYLLLANALNSGEYVDKGIALLDSLAPVFERGTGYLKYLYLDSYPYALTKIGHNARLKALMSDKIIGLDTVLNFNDVYAISRMYIAERKLDSAYIWKDKLAKLAGFPSDTSRVLGVQAYYYYTIGDYEAALKYYKERDVYAENVVGRALNSAVDYAAARHYKNVAVDTDVKLRKHIILVVILCVTVIGCIFLWLLDVRRRKRMFMNQMDEIGQSRDILDDTKSRFSDNIRELVGKYLAGVIRLYELQSTLPSSSPEAEKIHRRIAAELENLSSEEVRDIIIQAVNNTNGGIVDKLDRDFPKLKAEDRLVFALKACDVPSQIIGLFLNVQVSGYYSRRTRLIKKIENSSSPDKKSFLDLLS